MVEVVRVVEIGVVVVIRGKGRSRGGGTVRVEVKVEGVLEKKVEGMVVATQTNGQIIYLWECFPF